MGSENRSSLRLRSIFVRTIEKKRVELLEDAWAIVRTSRDQRSPFSGTPTTARRPPQHDSTAENNFEGLLKTSTTTTSTITTMTTMVTTRATTLTTNFFWVDDDDNNGDGDNDYGFFPFLGGFSLFSFFVLLKLPLSLLCPLLTVLFPFKSRSMLHCYNSFMICLFLRMSKCPNYV